MGPQGHKAAGDARRLFLLRIPHAAPRSPPALRHRFITSTNPTPAGRMEILHWSWWLPELRRLPGPAEVACDYLRYPDHDGVDI
jgi:hypothetical protein